MTSLQTMRIAGRALLRNKLRSFLTALGIIIGVGAVIAMVAIGDGAKSMVEQQFAAMGSEERRVGKECSELCRSRWSPYH